MRENHNLSSRSGAARGKLEQRQEQVSEDAFLQFDTIKDSKRFPWWNGSIISLGTSPASTIASCRMIRY